MRSGSGWLCRCPAHDDRKPSLSLSYSGDKLLAKCHAGCPFENVIDALKDRGLLDSGAYYTHADAPQANQRDYSAYARRIWRGSAPADGTAVETYLKSRAYTGKIPTYLRLHAGLKHSPSGLTFPAMVAGITVYPHHDIEAIHRTYLLHDGTGKATLEPTKMMLGACSGGAVRFGPFGGETLWIAEGIENGLSVFLVTGQPTWATLSTSGMKAVALPPPELVPHLRIAADHDAPGIEAAQSLAARELAIGRDVRIAYANVTLLCISSLSPCFCRNR